MKLNKGFQRIRFFGFLVAIFLLLTPITTTFCQSNPQIDSVLQELKKVPKDTNRVNSLIMASDILQYTEPLKALSFAKEAFALSEELSYTKGFAKTNRLLGLIYQSSELDSSLFHYLESLGSYQLLNDTLGCIDAYFNIANVYLQLSNFEEAKKHQLLCCQLSEKVKNHEYKFIANNGMAVFYIGFAMDQEKNKDSITALETYRQAVPFLQKAIDYADSIPSEFHASQGYGNLAYVKTALGEFDDALKYALRTLKSYQSHGYEGAYPISYTQIGDIYLKMKKYEQAIVTATKALKWSAKAEDVYAMRESYSILYKANQALGNYKQALVFGQKMFEYSEQLINIDREEQIARMQTKFDTEQVKQENELLKTEARIAEIDLKKQRIIIGFAIGLLVLTALTALLIYKNLVDKKRFGQKVQELQTAQARWFTNIAHELRTPLTLILGPIQHIIRHQNLSESFGEELEMIQKNGNHLVNRVNDILEISKLESGKILLNQQPKDLVNLTLKTIDNFQPLARQQGVTVSFSHNNRLVLNIDSNKVGTILSNFLSNAFKFSPSGGTICISWDFTPETDDTLDIKVQDSGIGIPEKELPHIFERFYQASHSDQSLSGGSGIGLALSKELAQLHGGTITACSQENQGATFVLSLPKSLIQEVVPLTSPKSYVLEYPAEPIEVFNNNDDSSKSSILLVEDHTDMRKYIREILADDYQVIEAADGQQALDKLEEVTPDLIISDVMMPVMDGLTLGKKLKESSKHRLTPFIALTAHANERDKLTAFRTGLDDYIVKPFDAQELLVRIQNLLTNIRERKAAISEALNFPEEKENGSTLEEELVCKLEKLVNEHLSDNQFSITSMVDSAGMSESSLRRLLKKATGLTPGQFIRELRLQKAACLLENQQFQTISEVVYAVGFEDASSFTRLFKKRYGKSPSSFYC